MNIFGGNTDVTYDQLQRRKKMAEQLMNPGTPRNVGEGLSAIGKALIGRAVEKKTSRQETAMRDQFNERFGQVAGKQAQAMADLYGNPMASDMQKQILGALMKKGVPGMSRGGIARGGMTVVGEAGPELVELPKGARVAQADPLALEDELDSYMDQYKTPNDAPPEVLQRMDEIMRALNPPKTEQKPINMENFYRNEREQYDPNYDPAMENFYRNEREQFDPNYKGREYPNMENFYRNELEQYAPQYEAPGSFDEGRFDDANAYQVADSGQIASDAQPSFADRAREMGLDLNVTQGQRTGQALRLLQAESVLRDLESQGTRTGQRAIEFLPDGIENLLIDEDYGRFKQARDAFAEAAMRADTGATINESEWPRIINNLMPQPGDGPERLAQRRAMREVFIQSLMASSGEAGAIMPKIGEPVVPIELTDPSKMSDEELLKALGR